MCGEQAPPPPGPALFLGSPPRVRGTVFRRGCARSAGGITPACAGNRGFLPRTAFSMWDHPRVCGEQLDSTRAYRPLSGSPPRVRGTDEGYPYPMQGGRITPACAGNSLTPVFAGETTTDHPRVCGEQKKYMLLPARAAGSPPRVRGTGKQPLPPDVYPGITPACAGNSPPYYCPGGRFQDHPRVCGEQHAYKAL